MDPERHATVQTIAKHQPLTEVEFDRLDEFLRQCKGGKAMNIEELDGFFAALVAGPDVVLPSEYYEHVFGGFLEHACEFDSIESAQAILGMLMRHWNTIAATLMADDVYLPILLENDAGIALANDWARGFMRGVDMRKAQWAELIRSDEHGGSILAILMLAHEHDPDPQMRPLAITPEKREEIIQHMAAGLMQIGRYFRARRSGRSAGAQSRTIRRNMAKVGRNDACPCGSGKKYKHCHGGSDLH